MIIKKIINGDSGSNCTIKADVVDNKLLISRGEYKLKGNILATNNNDIIFDAPMSPLDTYYEVLLTPGEIVIRYVAVVSWENTDMKDALGNIIEKNVLTYQTADELGEIENIIDRIAYFVIPANKTLSESDVYIIEVVVA